MYDFIDLHCHILCNIDDGAKNAETMYKMLDIAYSDGIRAICFTPHFKIYRFNNEEEISRYNIAIKERFDTACEYVNQHYPDMKLHLGNEIMYHNDVLDSLISQKCFTIANSSYILIEFPPHIGSYELKNATSKLLRKGFTPIIAHVERYDALIKDFSLLKDIKESGAVIQINSHSVTKLRFGKTAHFVKKALKSNLVDIVSTDAHDAGLLSPSLSKSYKIISRRYGKDYAKKIFFDNQLLILRNTH